MLANDKILLEVCCGTYQDVVTAKAAGADRIELNCALELGGLTPSRGVFLKSLELGIPLAVMVRPHTSSFTYSEADFETMLIDAKWFAENGAAGIVFGILNQDGTIDETRSLEMINVIGDVEAIYHKAFDLTPNLPRALEVLIKLGVKRVLTGGGPGPVGDNILALKGLHSRYGHLIELLPGGGVNPTNVVDILSETKIKQIHMSAKHQITQTITYPSHHKTKSVEQSYTAVSLDNLLEMIDIINQGENLYD